MELDTATRLSGTIRITADTEACGCNLWLGMFKSGGVDPSQLFTASDVNTVLGIAADSGLSSDDPLYVVLTHREPAAAFFLVPAPSDEEGVNHETVKMLEAVCDVCVPERVGLYLAPQLMAEGMARETMLHILRNFLLTTKVREFFLPIGNLTHNSLLNTAVWLKEQLERESVNVCVYH